MPSVNVKITQDNTDKIRAALTGGALMKAAILGCNVIETYAKLAMRGPKSGRTYSRGKKPHQASAPGEAPAMDTGALANSFTVEAGDTTPNGVTAVVGPTMEYGEGLELGTSRVQPRPYLRPAVDEHRDEIENVVREAIKSAIEGAL